MDVRREVIWTPWDTPGIEHLQMTAGQDEVVADSVIIGLAEGRPFRASYLIRCDGIWRVREIQVSLRVPGQHDLHLRADGEGHWTTAGGEAHTPLDGCLDVDLSATPLTNTLPIRRLGLRPGDSADIMAAFIAVPARSVTPRPQRYTRLDDDHDGGARYRYESRDGDFTVDLPVDADSLVGEYPGLFRRVWSS